MKAMSLLSWVSLLFLATVVQTQTQSSTPNSPNDYTCSPTKPCKLGCCGTSFYCGFGPDFCTKGVNCFSDCDRKSECDPGWGPQWSNASACPLNVCCSQYGFCGTTKEFCGDKVVDRPKCSSTGASAKKRVVGYYEAFNIRRCCDQRFPQDIYMGAWTHLNFAFAYIDPSEFKVIPMDPLDVQLYKKFTDLKKTYSNGTLQTWISIGGWAMNDPGPYSTTFSDLAANSTAMECFSTSLIAFMDQYGFDGVDIDWEYPVAEERSGRPEDLQNYVTWLTQLKGALGNKYGLTITVPSSYWYMRHFNVSKIADTVDWLNIMTYDLHGVWDGTNPYVGRYVDSHTNVTEIDQAMDLLWRNKIDPSKVSMGLGFYGRSFTLEDPSCSKAGCKWSDGGKPGACTKNVGTLSFAEIDEVLNNDQPMVTYDSQAMVNEVVWNQDQWVSLDDARAFTDKYAYANSRCLGGLLVWAVTLDTSDGKAHQDLCTALQCTTYRQGYTKPPCSCGSSGKCQRWHTVYEGDTCYDIYTNAGLTFDQFRALNPQIDSQCSNLKLGYQYCTAGDVAPPDQSTCQPGDYYTSTTTTTVVSTSLPGTYSIDTESSTSTTKSSTTVITTSSPGTYSIYTESSTSTSATSTTSPDTYSVYTESSTSSTMGSSTTSASTIASSTYDTYSFSTESSFSSSASSSLTSTLSSTIPSSTSSSPIMSTSSSSSSVSTFTYSTDSSWSTPSTYLIPSTSIPSTSIPSTSIPSTSIPSTSIPSTSIPSTSIPSTSFISSSDTTYQTYQTTDTESRSSDTTLTSTSVTTSDQTTTSDKTYDTSSQETTTTTCLSTTTSTITLSSYGYATEQSTTTTSCKTSTSSLLNTSTCSASLKTTKWIFVGCPETRYREL